MTVPVGKEAPGPAAASLSIGGRGRTAWDAGDAEQGCGRGLGPQSCSHPTASFLRGKTGTRQLKSRWQEVSFDRFAGADSGVLLSRHSGPGCGKTCEREGERALQAVCPSSRRGPICPARCPSILYTEPIRH